MNACLYVVSAPSGAGKTTLVRQLVAEDKKIHLSISCTTRPARVGEVNGEDYHFLDKETFQSRIDRGDFLEYAVVHGNFYGTSREMILEKLASGQDVLLEIDWQGAAQVREFFKEAVAIFILPPSMVELSRRLTARATDSEETIKTRLQAASAEMRHVYDFDYVIINDDLARAFGDLKSIIRSTRLDTKHQQARHPALFFELSDS